MWLCFASRWAIRVAQTITGHLTQHAACRYYVREIQETEASQIELFLNSVPILASLSRDEKLRLVDALEQQTFKPTARVINQVQRQPGSRCLAPHRPLRSWTPVNL